MADSDIAAPATSIAYRTPGRGGSSAPPQSPARLPGFGERIRLYVTGCPNEGGRHWIADVGLQGVLMADASNGGQPVEGFDVFVGGGVGLGASFARGVGFRATAAEVSSALERLCPALTDGRTDGESFRTWTARVGDSRVKAALARG
jgi:sulfite reductase beta subunit-like hemoprotein